MSVNRSAHGTLRLHCDAEGCETKFSPRRPLMLGGTTLRPMETMAAIAVRGRAMVYQRGRWAVADGPEWQALDFCPAHRGPRQPDTVQGLGRGRRSSTAVGGEAPVLSAP